MEEELSENTGGIRIIGGNSRKASASSLSNGNGPSVSSSPNPTPASAPSGKYREHHGALYFSKTGIGWEVLEIVVGDYLHSRGLSKSSGSRQHDVWYFRNPDPFGSVSNVCTLSVNAYHPDTCKMEVIGRQNIPVFADLARDIENLLLSEYGYSFEIFVELVS